MISSKVCALGNIERMIMSRSHLFINYRASANYVPSVLQSTECKKGQCTALHSEKPPHFCPGRLCVIIKTGITEEMPSVFSDIPRMIFIKPGYVLDTEDPPEQGPVELSFSLVEVYREGV